MVRFDHGRAGSVTPLDVVREAVVDARVDVELAYPSDDELALDRLDESPRQATPAVRGIDKHIQKSCPISRARSGHSEPDERGAVPESLDHRIAVGGLPAHLTR
jgi:hypothetical protein